MVNQLRFGGLASGIDTQSMVQQLMQVERMRMNRFVRQEKRTEWRQEAMHNANRQMANFVLDMRRGFGLNQVSFTGQFRAASVNQFDWVKSAQSSNEIAVTARATASAMNGTHSVTVERLATGASAMSVNLKDMVLAGGEKLLNEDGRTFSAAAIDAEKTIVFTVGNREETFAIGTNGSSVNDLVRFINNTASSDGRVAVNAAYDFGVGGIMVNSRQTGDHQVFSFGGTLGQDLFRAENVRAGENATIHFNGQKITQTTNQFSVFGINLNLRAAETATLNVSTDADSIVNKISEFVSNYNSLLDTLNGKLTETFYRDYEPLTNEEKEAMSDRDVQRWEERSRSGLLRNDETINRLMQQLRAGLYATVEGATGSFNHITQIGITTGNFRDGGKLVINEDRLREAIANDVDGVMSLLFNVSGSTNDTTRTSENGLIQRLNDSVVTGMQSLVSRGGTGADGNLFRSVQGNMLIDFVTRQSSISLLQRNRASLNQRIVREEGILARKEQNHWARFTAMEKAMQKMNSQADWLGAQMGQWQR